MLRCKICGRPHYEANPRSTAQIKAGQPCAECEASLATMKGKREKNIERLRAAYQTPPKPKKKARKPKKAKPKKPRKKNA